MHARHLPQQTKYPDKQTTPNQVNEQNNNVLAVITMPPPSVLIGYT